MESISQVSNKCPAVLLMERLHCAGALKQASTSTRCSCSGHGQSCCRRCGRLSSWVWEAEPMWRRGRNLAGATLGALVAMSFSKGQAHLVAWPRAPETPRAEAGGSLPDSGTTELRMHCRQSLA